MSRFIIAAVLAGFAAAASAQGYPPPPPPPGQGSVPSANVHFGWAEVLRADPVYAAVAPPPQQQCYPQTVTRQDNNHTGGTVLGAIVGGVLGSTVGKGDGRRAATVAGAVAGGAVGNRVSAAHDRDYTTQQTVCQPVNYPPQQQIVAYDVEYRYRGDVYMSRLPYDPGERLRVRVSVAPAD
ncbi:MAG TPA: glycine zipper 2TM domain-containing protein [Rhodanobacteraceae bacterium]|nr:glycine zipper 2TM domain-containing protein [Rhodanobacteraceae bacterium]